MARKRKKIELRAGELNLTAMIDVAFQLLSFFIITVRPTDVFTNLDVFRPMADPHADPAAKPPNLVRIGVYQDGYTVNDNQATLEVLDKALAKVAAIDAGQTLMLTVSSASQHGQLVKALDLCAKNGLTSLSIVSASN